MSDQYDDGGRDAESREGVAYVCDQLEQIRGALATTGAEGVTPLERLLAALRAGEDLTAPLDALHEALLAAGDAAGVHGRARGRDPIGVNPALPDEWVLLCPTRQCSRFGWPDGLEEPDCRISGRPLRRERL
ncbi:hypothetical protein [Streptomyces sp. NPDC097981]|uniref:hypothetical protein n=1 Tax=Streptomyces sp. NPDC097981 TaxID=3155428 RepID=UPI00332B1146